MAREDRRPFEMIQTQFGFSEADLIKLMRRELKENSSSFGGLEYTFVPVKSISKNVIQTLTDFVALASDPSSII